MSFSFPPSIFSRTCKQGKVELLSLKLRRRLCTKPNSSLKSEFPTCVYTTVCNWVPPRNSTENLWLGFHVCRWGSGDQRNSHGPRLPFHKPSFEAAPPQLCFLSTPFKDFYFIFIFFSLGKSRGSWIPSSTLTKFAVILKHLASTSWSLLLF